MTGSSSQETLIEKRVRLLIFISFIMMIIDIIQTWIGVKYFSMIEANVYLHFFLQSFTLYMLFIIARFLNFAVISIICLHNKNKKITLIFCIVFTIILSHIVFNNFYFLVIKWIYQL